MENNSEEKNGSSYNNISWTHIRQFPHQYIINVPKTTDESFKVEVDLPSPTFHPVEVKDYAQYTELFPQKRNLKNNLKYYRKLYSQGNHRLLNKIVKNNEFILLPQYVVDVAQGEFEDHDDHAWSYTGGNLDCFYFKDNMYAVRAGFRQPPEVINIDAPTSCTTLKIDNNSPVYNLKSVSFDDDVFLSVRQKHKVSVFQLCLDDCNLRTQTAWKIKTTQSFFVDTAFNEFSKYEMSAIDANHNLKVADFLNNKILRKYSFPSKFDTLNDSFAQINYIDHNTLVFINRTFMHVLDVRSLSIQSLNLKTSWLQCDDLCTFSKNKENNYMNVSSKHNIIKLDIRSLKLVDKTSHLLSTPPFISSLMADGLEEYICLSGQKNSDKVFVQGSHNSLNMPQYIPNTKDTLTLASLTKRINLSANLEERLTLPTLGMKLFKDISGDITLYTLNAAGDVFQQKFLRTKPVHTEAVNKLVDWSNELIYKPKILQATSICNLSNIMHTMSARFPEEKKLNALMKENSSQKLFEKEFSSITKHLESSVGDAINLIWTDEQIVGEDDADLPSAVASKRKVSQWLHSVL